MKLSIFMTTLIFSFSVSASVPTVEGLFRNAHNAAIKGNTAAVSFTIESLRVDKAKENVEAGGILTPLKSIGTGDETEFEKKSRTLQTYLHTRRQSTNTNVASTIFWSRHVAIRGH
jgi:hypothetical protein